MLDRLCAGPRRVRRVNARDLRVATAADFASVLSVGAQFDEGWQATIDGEPADTFAVDGFFVGTYVPAGAHDVQVPVRPDWLAPPWCSTALGLLGAGALDGRRASLPSPSPWRPGRCTSRVTPLPIGC